jgi:very-short-patch-repair endonuclease
MWDILSGQIRQKFPNHIFRRQYVQYGYILDFYCPTLRMGIEVDGYVHDEQRQYDSRRDNALARHGIQIFRFNNDDVLYNTQVVASELRQIIEGKDSHRSFITAPEYTTTTAQTLQTKTDSNCFIATAAYRARARAIDRIISNVIGVLTVVGATYGVLFALVASEKASMAFSSWAFVIWCGWVLALLMRICSCGSLLLGDYYRWDREKRKEILYGISRFSKHSTYLLVPTASFVPLFATMKAISLDEIVTTYPWGQDMSLFLGVFSIAAVAIFFYAFVLALGKLTKRHYADIYMYVVPILWGLGLASVSLSPLAPVTNKIVGLFLFQLTVPSVVAVLGYILFSMVGLTMGFFVIVGLLMRVISKLYKAGRNRRS